MSTEHSPDMSGWTIAERYITERLDRIENKVDSHTEGITQIRADVSGLKVRTGLFASVFGILGGYLAFLFKG